MKGPTPCEDANDEEDPYAQEMAIFLAEINQCESGSNKTNDNPKEHANGEMEKFKVITGPYGRSQTKKKTYHMNL